MLNAMHPGTIVPIYRHLEFSENFICISGHLDRVLYDDNGNEIEHVEVLEPSIYEGKDGAYGKDGSESREKSTETAIETKSTSSTFQNSSGDLKKNIDYLLSMSVICLLRRLRKP